MKINQEDIQGNIKTFVDEYKKLFPIEYAMFLKQMEMNKLNTYNKFAEIKGTDALERKLIEYPETLYTILYDKLSPEGLAWLTTKKGARWFARKFPEFKVATKI